MSIGNAATSVILQCAISIGDMFPFLRDSFHDGFVFIGQGQHLILNAMLVEPKAVRGISTQNNAEAARDFEISKAQLVKVFSKLDGNLISQIQRASVPIHKINATLYTQSLSNSVVFNVNLSKQERLKYLYFAISPAVDNTVNGAVALADAELAVDAAGAPYATANFGVALRSVYHNLLFRACTLIQVNFGGHTWTLNQQQLQSAIE